MKTVKEILAAKGSDTHTTTPESSVYDALVLMAQKDIGALVVVEDGQVVGILSERDYARKVILRGESSRELQVRKIMTRKVVCVSEAMGTEECTALMTGQRIRHLPVLANEQLVGVISIGDIVKATMAEQEFLIEQLEDYIRGSG